MRGGPGMPIVWGLLATSSIARAEPPAAPALSWSRSEGAEACIARPELAKRVEAQLGRAILVALPQAQLNVEGAVELAEPGYRVHLRLSDPDGTTLGDRVLVAATRDCRALDPLLVFLIALYSIEGAAYSDGLYDISDGATSGSQRCSQPYRIFVLIESESDGTVLFQEATVTLFIENGEKLEFGDNDPALDNPFTLTPSGRVVADAGKGIVPFDAIPTAYAPFLSELVGHTIVVEAQLEGRTPSAKLIRTQTVRFPVELCDGCLSKCESLLSDPQNPLNRDDFAQGECDDNAGANGRICWDSEC